MAKAKTTRKKKRSAAKKKLEHVDISAKKPGGPDASTARKIAVFRIGEEMYAFYLNIIMETLYTYTIKPVAHLPDVYKGVVTFKKRSVPVVDMRELLSIGNTRSTDPVCVILKMNKVHMGFLIDTDVDIIPESMGKHYPLPDCYTIEEAEFIEGIFWLDQRFVGILDPRRMMEVLANWREGDETK